MKKVLLSILCAAAMLGSSQAANAQAANINSDKPAGMDFYCAEILKTIAIECQDTVNKPQICVELEWMYLILCVPNNMGNSVNKTFQSIADSVK